MLLSTVAGSKRVSAPGVEVVLEVVRKAVIEQFPTLRPTLYPGFTAMDPRPYTSLDVMWKTFADSLHIKTPAVNSEKYVCLPAFSTGT